MFRNLEYSFSDDASDYYTDYSYDTDGSESYHYACKMVDDPLEVCIFANGNDVHSKRGLFGRRGDDKGANSMSMLTVLTALDNAVDTVVDTLIPIEETPTRKQLIMKKMKSAAQLNRRREKERSIFENVPWIDPKAVDSDWWKSFAPVQGRSSLNEKKDLQNEQTQKKRTTKLFSRNASKLETERNKQGVVEKSDTGAKALERMTSFKMFSRSKTESNTMDMIEEDDLKSKYSKKNSLNLFKRHNSITMNDENDSTTNPTFKKNSFFSSFKKQKDARSENMYTR